MKKILLGLLGLIVLGVVILGALVAFVPTDFALEREVVINMPKDKVFTYVKSLKNQEKWSAWAKKDPNSKYTYTGTDGEVGFITAWDSDHPDVGKGEQEIKKIDEGKRVDVELRFKHPFESKSDGYMITEALDDNKTKLKWGFSGSMPRPFNLMTLFIDMEEAVGKDFNEGLGSLKEILDKIEKTEAITKDIDS